MIENEALPEHIRVCYEEQTALMQAALAAIRAFAEISNKELQGSALAAFVRLELRTASQNMEDAMQRSIAILLGPEGVEFLRENPDAAAAVPEKRQLSSDNPTAKTHGNSATISL